MPRPLLLLEINEVPWRIIDHFKSDLEYPSLKMFFESSETWTTETVDHGELSPWITWPTVHRGASSDVHHIRFLGQDPKTFRGRTIWEEAREAGYSIGVCGSLQSWPPLDPGEGGFYFPDTFSRDEQCIPKWLEPFQRLVLNQVSKSGRVIDRKSVYSFQTLKDLLRLAPTLPRLGIRAKTVLRTLQQLLLEKKDPVKLSRRPIFQSILVWDVFRTLYQPQNPPLVATLFTNHVASAMHRYWNHIFPSDFNDRPDLQPVRGSNYLDTVKFALKFCDEMIHEVMRYQAINPNLIVVVASSMGQGPKVWDNFEGYALVVNNLDKLMTTCGLRKDQFQRALAMVPQTGVVISEAELRRKVIQKLESSKTPGGERIFEVQEEGDSLSLTICLQKAKEIEANSITIENQTYTWDELGIKTYEVESGTAYHIPEGILAIRGEGIPVDPDRKRIPADQVKNLLMKKMGLMA